MNLHAINPPRRRGACPGLSAPMPTGDGLLVRLLPIGTMPLAAFAELCAEAREHGNGIVEVTARGSIQVRGLTPTSASRFAAGIAALGIAADDGVPVLTGAFAGLDPEELLDAGALAADLRRALAQTRLVGTLAPKVSVTIDGGGELSLDELAADVRLRAEATKNGTVLHVGVGGNAAGAAQLGPIAPHNGVEAALRLLKVIARRGREARARDIIAVEGVAPFQSALTHLLVGDASPTAVRGYREAIGLHALHDGLFAYGVGLAFGHSDAATLENLAEAAGAAGAIGLRAGPGRVLLVIGLKHEMSSVFAAAAERLGFIVRADDPRRRVVACAGAPICSSAHIAARAIAPVVAQALAPHLRCPATIHISGCAKGCAHPAPAALTIVGTPGGCALIADGSPRNTPFATVATDELPAAIISYARKHERGASHV